MIEARVIAAQDANNPWLQNVLDFLGKTKFACAFYNVKAETRGRTRTRAVMQGVCPSTRT